MMQSPSLFYRNADSGGFFQQYPAAQRSCGIPATILMYAAFFSLDKTGIRNII